MKNDVRLLCGQLLEKFGLLFITTSGHTVHCLIKILSLNFQPDGRSTFKQLPLPNPFLFPAKGPNVNALDDGGDSYGIT